MITLYEQKKKRKARRKSSELRDVPVQLQLYIKCRNVNIFQLHWQLEMRNKPAVFGTFTLIYCLKAVIIFYSLSSPPTVEKVFLSYPLLSFFQMATTSIISKTTRSGRKVSLPAKFKDYVPVPGTSSTGKVRKEVADQNNYINRKT